MRSDLPLDALSARRAGRARRRRRALGSAITLAILIGLVVARYHQLDHGGDAAAARGALALRAAVVAGDAAAWDRAEAAFAAAARGGVLDVYPIFCLELTRRLRGDQVARVEPALVPAVEALGEGDLAAAEAALAAAPTAEGHRWLARLLREMRAAPAD
ncbi:MAG: hypothetical protein CSA66_01495 [Proteobacteria bacterium]|nr:MAG: hypothetical protein CSA66_01495 [Pseudomonadota bacterium]